MILGTGVTKFVPMRDCGRIPIFHGSQGGYHVWGSVRARYMEFQKVKIQYTVTDLAGHLLPYPDGRANPTVTTFDLDPLSTESVPVGDGERGAAAVCGDGGYFADGGASSSVPDGADGWGQATGDRIYMPFGAGDAGLYRPTEDVDGRRIRIELKVTDSSGRSATDVRTPVLYFFN